MTGINEKELREIFLELKQNNEKAFEELYLKYNKLVYSIAFNLLKNKTDSEDVTQTIFTKIYEMEKDKLPTKNEASWIYSITKNETISMLRRKKDDIDLEKIYEIEDRQNEIENAIDKESYNKLISKLSEKEKEIISLKVVSNMTFGDISKLLGEPIGTVKWRYYKSVHTLKIIISNLGMFVITFIIGLKVLLNKEKTDNTNKEESTIKYKPESCREEEITIDKAEQEMNTVEKNETIETINIENNNSNLGIRILGISVIFLIITIFFFIKYQLKMKSKTSK